VTRAAAIVCTLVLVGPGIAVARPGDLSDPLRIPGFPFNHSTTTLDRTSSIAQYSCAAQSEAGPEIVYAFASSGLSVVSATVYEADVSVDVDIHILSSLTVDGSGTAVDCLARGNQSASTRISAGTYYLVVDTYRGAQKAGMFRLRADLQPMDAFYARSIARGVTLETKLYSSLFGGAQSGAVLKVDLTDPDVMIKPLRRGAACLTTSESGLLAGAVAAVNGGFYSTPGCASVSLIKIDGSLIATNSVTRTAFGVGADRHASLALIAGGQDWPSAIQAIGGAPRIVTGRQVDLHTAQEMVESTVETSVTARTGAGIAPDGSVVLATTDSGSVIATGMGLADFAQWMIDLGAVDAVNLSGAASTTLWALGEQNAGLVNTPLNGAEQVQASAIGIFAKLLDRPAIWLTKPEARALQVGDTWIFEAVVADPEGQAIAFRFDPGTTDGHVRVMDRGDGTARYSYVPSTVDVERSPVSLVFFADVQTSSTSSIGVELQVLPRTGPQPGLDGGASEGTTPVVAAEIVGSEKGCGCSVDGSATPRPIDLLLAIGGGALSIISRRASARSRSRARRP
jgi:hypothetical protein